MTDQSDADPVEIVLAWLQGHAGVISAFGGADHISGVVEAPWPRLRVIPGAGGDLRQLHWSLVGEVIIEVYSSPTGGPGSAEMRRLCMVVLAALRELADRDDVTATEAVVSKVEPTGVPAPSLGAGTQTLTSGQLKWTVSVAVTCRPPELTPPS